MNKTWVSGILVGAVGAFAVSYYVSPHDIDNNVYTAVVFTVLFIAFSWRKP